MGANKITSNDLIAWCWNTGNTLLLWERRAIAAIDSAYIGQKNGH